MLINYIELNNIRSYKSQKIQFNIGKSMLGGDIGSGKSSLLLSIEFALFGLLRGGSGSTLLRHGCSNGNVKLSITIDEKKIIIFRGLKRGPEGNVTQDKGYISIDGDQFDGMPTEITARTLELIGYPSDATKKDNFIYRFTVYTPQEEMKKILFESAENRLNTIRKIFSLDKYKDIRENLQIIIKELRVKQREIDSYCKDLPEKKKILENSIESIKVLQGENSKIKLKLEEEELKLQEINKRIVESEKLIRVFYSEKEKLSLAKNNIKNNEQQLIINTKKLDSNILKTSDFEKTIIKKIDLSITNIGSMVPNNNGALIQKLDNVKSVMNMSENNPKGKDSDSLWIINITNQLKIISEEIEAVYKDDDEKNLSKIKEFEEKISSANFIITQSETLKKKILDLNNCPTCMQEVKDEYKNSIIQKETDKQNNANSKKQDILNELNNIKNINKDIASRIKSITDIKNSLRIINVESKVINDATKEINILKDAINKIQESNSTFEKESVIIQAKVNELSKSEEEYNNIKKLKEEQERKTKLEQIKLTRNTTEIEEKNKNIVLFEKEIKTKEVQLKKHAKISIYIEWFNNFFNQLMIKIERQILWSLLVEFNELFVKWFNILIEDDSITVRLDEEFTPVIIQNGYETEIENLSGGEKTALALAYRLALNKTINDFMTTIKTKDIIILDEPTDGFSDSQLDRIKDVLDILGLKQTIVVSHESKIESLVDNVIRINKSENESYIV